MLWFIPGVILALGYAVSGVALCLTIIGIPFGIQSFKFIPLALLPFGKEVISQDELAERLRRPPPVAPSQAPPPPSRGRPLPPHRADVRDPARSGSCGARSPGVVGGLRAWSAVIGGRCASSQGLQLDESPYPLRESCVVGDEGVSLELGQRHVLAVAG